MGTRIHSTAVIHPETEIGSDVEVGPYAIVGAGVTLGRGTRLSGHVVIEGPTRLGEENIVFPFAVLGTTAQYRAITGKASSSPESGSLDVGRGNVFREHVTVHRGTGGRATVIGDANLFMAAAHVAHDVTVGSNVTLANAVQLAGHAKISDYATFGGLSGVAQFVAVGESAFVAAGAMCERDVPPFVVVQGDRARVRALNTVGLRRRGLDDEAILRLQRAFRALFARRRPLAVAVEELSVELRADPLVRQLLAALRSPQSSDRARHS